MTVESNAPFITNLVNSIIGVSVLAMPYCMKKCGFLLGLGLLMGMSWLTYISCNMLITAAAVKRRRTYEYLAFYTVGPTGKLAVEFSMIGLMLGTCVAFYVIIGDLATAILQGFVEAEPVQLRTFVIVFCALCVALPLGLMKNLSVLGFIGVFSLIFYCIFVCVMIANSVSSGFLSFQWFEKIELFRPAGVFQCLPIFSLAYACQCQLFVVYDSLEDAPVKRMETIVAYSLKIVSFVYFMVAILGYTTYIDAVEGNVLKNFSPNFVLDLIKFGFAISVVVGFPLMIFPCRQSIHTLFFSQHPADGVPSKTYIEPFTFKAITLCIVLTTMMVAIFIPNVETILGLTGATMGSCICFIFPGIIFPRASPKGTTAISKFVLAVGFILLVLCTYSNVYSATENSKVVPNRPVFPPPVEHLPPESIVEENVADQPKKPPSKAPVAEVVDDDHRHEPANPVEPVLPEKEIDFVEESDIQKNVNEINRNALTNEKPLDGKDKSERGENDVPQVVAPNEKKDEDLEKPISDKSLENHAKVEVIREEDQHQEVDSEKLSNKENIDTDLEKHAEVNEEGPNKEAIGLPDPNVIADEEKLLHIIKEHHKEQHKLLDAQEVLIQALEKQHDQKAVKQGEPPVKVDDSHQNEESFGAQPVVQQQMQNIPEKEKLPDSLQQLPVLDSHAGNNRIEGKENDNLNQQVNLRGDQQPGQPVNRLVHREANQPMNYPADQSINLQAKHEPEKEQPNRPLNIQANQPSAVQANQLVNRAADPHANEQAYQPVNGRLNEAEKVLVNQQVKMPVNQPLNSQDIQQENELLNKAANGEADKPMAGQDNQPIVHLDHQAENMPLNAQSNRLVKEAIKPVDNQQSVVDASKHNEDEAAAHVVQDEVMKPADLREKNQLNTDIGVKRINYLINNQENSDVKVDHKMKDLKHEDIKLKARDLKSINSAEE